MIFFNNDRQKQIRHFLERTGILFPKGKRSGHDRRMSTGINDSSFEDYLAMEETDRQHHFVMRSNIDRREESFMSTPLGGML